MSAAPSRIPSDPPLSARVEVSLEATLIALIEQYDQKLHRLVLGIVGNPDEADDVVQEVWVKVAASLPQLKDTERIDPWLVSIARNTAIDLLRSRQRGSVVIFPTRVEPQSSPGLEGDPASSVLFAEHREFVWRALGVLRERDRTVLVLREFDGLSYAEISEVLGVSRATAHVIVSRARQRFRREFTRQQRG